jgi:DNA-binding GntR family transcriptional regulator
LNLVEQLAGRIEALIAEAELPLGTRLPERRLAERFRVSRSPVREALRRLAEKSVVEVCAEGGYAVRKRPKAAAPQFATPPADPFESVYLQIAEDRLGGLLPERFSENELMRRYGLTRPRLARVLRRIQQEGWAERLPGHGWQFLPILTSTETYDQGYRFRILMESAAILEPGFQVDESALRKCLQEQQALADGAIEWASPAQIFDANTRLHETIAAFSGNVFIIDSLKRINRLRRLMEYRKAIDREAAARRCREHRVLIELLLTGQRDAAADFIRLHLRDAARDKSGWPRAA